MSKATFAQTNFTLGEISPRALGRFDEDRAIFKNSAKTMLNWLTFDIGGAMFRPGTYYMGQTKYSDKETRLEPFIYSNSQKYDIEIGDLYMRFFTNGGALAPGGITLELVSPYLEADVFSIITTQKDDVMYLFGAGKYPVYKLIRTSSTSFKLNKVIFVRGPFRDTNVGNVTIEPSDDTGNGITLTAVVPDWATATNYIPGDYVKDSGVHYLCVIPHVSNAFANDLTAGYWLQQDFFQAGHANSLWRIKSGVVLITGYTSSTVLVGNVQTEPDGTAGALATGPGAVSDWAEGLYSDFRGHPTCGVFHEDRLVMGGPGQTFCGSVVGAYENYDAGAANDSDAYQFTITSSQVNSILWLMSDTALKIGTNGGTGSAVSPSGTIISAANPPTITLDTDYAASSVKPCPLSSFIYYLQSDNFTLRQLEFDLYLNKDRSEKITKFSDHILRDGQGAVQMDRQQSPNDRIWAIRKDGIIAVLTRNAEEKVMSWVRIQAAGSGPGLGAGQFKSVSITHQVSSDDNVTVIVKRNIAGTFVQNVEYFSPELFDNYWEPVRLDCAFTLDNPLTVTAITNNNPGVITSIAHGLVNGDRIKIDIVKGMTDLNQNIYYVANAATDSFTLQDSNGNDIDTTNFGVYVSGGQVRKSISNPITGLDIYEGETVTVVCDGGVAPQQSQYLVTSGEINLLQPAFVIHIGLPYSDINSNLLEFVPLGAGGQTGTAQTQQKAMFEIALRVWQTQGGQFGAKIGSTQLIKNPNQIPNLPSGRIPAPYTGDIHFTSSAGSQRLLAPVIYQDQPLPFMLLAAVIRINTEET